MKKCILSIGVALLLGLFLVLSIASADGEVAVTVDASDQVDEGVNFIVTVTVGTVTGFDACNYDVVFDSAVITLTSVTDGDIGGTTIPVVVTNTLAPGTVRVVENVGGTTGVTGTGYLAELHFTVIGSSGTSSDISFENGILGDKDANEITATWTGDSVNVVALVAAFTVAGEGGTTGGYIDVTTFNFTDNTAGGTTPYTAWAWTFGDAGTGNVQNPTHIYTSAGTYDVVLAVTDTWSGTDTETKAGHVTVYDTLVAGFSGSTSEAIKGSTLHPSTVQFTDGSSGGKASYTYDWNFGDGTTHGTAASPSHTYDPPGTKTGLKYAVTLTVDDSLTASDDEEKEEYITIYQMGDINKSLTVDGTDITKIERFVAALDLPVTFTADANEDGNINALDITKSELLVTAAS